MCLKMRKQSHRLAAWLPKPLRSLHRKNNPSTIFSRNVKSSNHFLLLYSPVCVGPGRKPLDRFSLAEAHAMFLQGKIQRKMMTMTTQLKTFKTKSEKSNI